MKKVTVKMGRSYGYVGTCSEDTSVHEFDDHMTKEEIQEELDEWARDEALERVDYWAVIESIEEVADEE